MSPAQILESLESSGLAASDVVKWTWAAFLLTATTGFLMFMTNAADYFRNPMFRLEMLSIALAGINLLIFQLTIGRTAHRWDNNGAAPLSGKIAAVFSSHLWISVIFFGSWIGFTTTGNETPDLDIHFDGTFRK